MNPIDKINDLHAFGSFMNKLPAEQREAMDNGCNRRAKFPTRVADNDDKPMGFIKATFSSREDNHNQGESHE